MFKIFIIQKNSYFCLVGYDAEYLVVGSNALVRRTASLHRVGVKKDASRSSET
jgi:hypothetical protein